MMTHKKIFIAFIYVFFVIVANSQSIVINEFLASNNSIITDYKGDYTDFIELYNNSNDTISLQGYKLSDNEENPLKWEVPDIQLNPKCFLLIFASGKDTLVNGEVHTNFKISADGEPIILTSKSNIIIDSFASIPLNSNESYGRLPDGSNTTFILHNATPGYSNTFNNVNNQLIFSKLSGFYQNDFNLTITTIGIGKIHYTLNGDIPNTNDSTYRGGIPIKCRNNEPNFYSEIPTTSDNTPDKSVPWRSPQRKVKKATVLRCALFMNDSIVSPVYSHTYFVDSTYNYNLPVISIITEGENFFDDTIGIYVPGIHYNPNNPYWTGNFFKRGDNWERPIHIEYFDSNGKSGFAQNAGARIFGGFTRYGAQKSLRIHARNNYGDKYFNYKLFPNRDLDKTNCFILRTTMGASKAQTIFGDALAHNIVSNLNIDYQDFRPSIVFINGEYWGIHTIRERIDEKYIEAHYGIDDDSVIMEELYYGNLFWDLKDTIIDMDFSSTKDYEYINSVIDINSFIDYHIAEMFFANKDWPRSNNKWWKTKNTDSKWKWIFYDIDGGYGSNAARNMYTHLTQDNIDVWPYFPDAALLFRKLITNSEFVELFIDRYNFLLNNNFKVNNTLNKYNSIKQLYENEITGHSERWSFPDSYSSWQSAIESNIKSFLINRPCDVSANTQYFFSLNSFGVNCNDNTDNKNNNFILYPNPNRGTLYIQNNINEVIGLNIEIYNLLGHKIYTENNISIPEFSSSNSIKFPVHKCTMYIVKLKINGNVEHHKLILE
ncbi:MAG: CotH kinase family protein [Salinivirgaceae bacterium]|jgi:hypothetical protein|nr:CotH kinase family protein [Salinivirgaceae bacterium]